MPHPEVDAELIAELTAQLEKNGLTEIEWKDGERSIRVARNPAGGASPESATHAANAPAAASAPTAAPAPAPGPGDVRSPMVGTVFVAPEPGAPPFVEVGAAVVKGQTVLIVEAMKTMNPILAPTSGTVERIVVADGEPIEYGQLLMTLA